MQAYKSNKQRRNFVSAPTELGEPRVCRSAMSNHIQDMSFFINNFKEITDETVSYFIQMSILNPNFEIDKVLNETDFVGNLFQEALELKENDKSLKLYSWACSIIMNVSKMYFQYFPEEIVITLFYKLISTDDEELIKYGLNGIYKIAKHGFLVRFISYEMGIVQKLYDICMSTNHKYNIYIILKIFGSKSFQMCYDRESIQLIAKLFIYFISLQDIPVFEYLKYSVKGIFNLITCRCDYQLHYKILIEAGLCKSIEHAQWISYKRYKTETNPKIKKDADNIVEIGTKIINFIALSDNDLNKLTPIRYVSFYKKLYKSNNKNIVLESLRFILIAIPGMQKFENILLESEKNYDTIINVAKESFFEARILAGHIISHIIINGNINFYKSFISKQERIEILISLFQDSIDSDKSVFFLEAFNRLLESSISLNILPFIKSIENEIHYLMNNTKCHDEALQIISKIK